MALDTNTCNTIQSYASATSAVGYAMIQCYGTDSNGDDDNKSSGMAPGTIAAIVIPIAVVGLGLAAAAYYFFVVMPAASSLAAPLISPAAGAAGATSAA